MYIKTDIKMVIKKMGYAGWMGVSFFSFGAQELRVGVDTAQEYFGAGYDRDEKAQQELREWLLGGVPGEFGDQAGDQLGEQERDFLDLPEPERFMASEPRQLITPISPESLSGNYADGEDSSASRELFDEQSTSRSASRDGSGSDDAGLEDGYTADFDEQGRRLRRPRLIRQEKLLTPAILRAQARAQSWTYAESAPSQEAYRQPTNDHKERMQLAMQELQDSYSN